MPLIDITATTDYYPKEDGSRDSVKQSVTADLGRDLPQMIIDHCRELELDAADTPIEGVQVDFHRYHPKAVNPADIWLLIRFAEDKPESEGTQRRIRTTIKQMIDDWFIDNDRMMPNIAVDIQWDGSRGFLSFRTGIQIFW